MFKRILLFLVFLLLPLFAQAQNKTEFYFFYSESCPHCHKEALFLDKLEEEYGPKINIQRLEVSSQANINLMFDLASKLNTSVSGVPFTVIGDKYFIGYYNDEVTGEAIKQAVEDQLNASVNNIVWPLKPSGQPEPNTETSSNQIVDVQQDNINENIDVPFLGNIDPSNFSLPTLSVVLGFIDGFNPCAMWALIFLISLLLGMENKKRMWVLGTAFIFTSALVYFLFMVAWLNIFLFLGLVLWVRILIALVALLGGSYNIREFFKNKAGTCKLEGQDKKKKVFDKLKEITQQKSFALAFLGIILLALAVNMVELICSAGLPAVYTHILSLNNLSNIQHYSYILLYIFFFMLDDMLVFFTAMITLHLTGLSTKYSRYSSLVGGTLMFVIGILLLFKYDWLTFS